jgi:hypothetical protein
MTPSKLQNMRLAEYLNAKSIENEAKSKKTKVFVFNVKYLEKRSV